MEDLAIRLVGEAGLTGLLAIIILAFRKPIAELLQARAAEARAAADFYPVAKTAIDCWDTHRVIVEQHGEDTVRLLRKIAGNGRDEDADAARH